MPCCAKNVVTFFCGVIRRMLRSTRPFILLSVAPGYAAMIKRLLSRSKAIPLRKTFPASIFSHGPTLICGSSASSEGRGDGTVGRAPSACTPSNRRHVDMPLATRVPNAPVAAVFRNVLLSSPITVILLARLQSVSRTRCKQSPASHVPFLYASRSAVGHTIRDGHRLTPSALPSSKKPVLPRERAWFLVSAIYNHCF